MNEILGEMMKTMERREIIGALLLVITLLAIVAPAGAAVTISPTGGDDTALIAGAISSAASDDHIVILNPGTYLAHDIVVPVAVTIRADTANGHGPADTIIDAQSLGRIFDAGNNALAIDNLTLQNGNASIDSYSGCGGAIFVYHGSVVVTSSIISNCRAGDSFGGGYGGAIFTFFDGSGTVRFCRLIGNYAPFEGDTFFGYGPITAPDNWWGSNAGPSSGDLYGATAPTWLRLGITADPAAITTGETSAIRANLTYNNIGADTSGSGTVPDGIPAAFATSDGSVSPGSATTVSGIASGTFTPSSSGTATVSVTVDGVTVSVPVEVTPPPVTALETDPGSASTVYAGLDGAGVYRSTDYGGSWTQLPLPPGANTYIRALAVFRPGGGTDTTVYAGTYGGGVYRSTDSGDTWTSCSALPYLNVLSLVTSTDGRLYAGTEGGVYTSTDGCDSWLAVNEGLP